MLRSDSPNNAQASVARFKCLHSHGGGGGQAALSFSRLALEGGDEFSSHQLPIKVPFDSTASAERRWIEG